MKTDFRPRYAVFGLGKLGACIAATLADRGFGTIGIEVDEAKVAAVNAGRAPAEEPGLGAMVRKNRSRLRASSRPVDAAGAETSFFIPPTPSLPNGSYDTEYLLRAMHSLALALKKGGKRGHLFVCSSTTTPGACEGVLLPMLERTLGGKRGRDFGFCYNPEFIALGDVIRGLLEPDLVLIGESDPRSGQKLEAFYRRYLRNQAPIERMSIPSAEVAKISVNSFVTMKISFTNQIRLLAERFPGVSAPTVLRAIGKDRRIGGAYLKPGLSFGGPCFPRDNRLLRFTAAQRKLELPLAEATDRVNEMVKSDLLASVGKAAPSGARVLVLGMAYRPNTWLTEEAAGLALAQGLHRSGRKVSVHDPLATPENSPALREFLFVANWKKALQKGGWKAVVVCNPCQEYADLRLGKGTRLFDPWSMTS
jgi:UDPglucose 6-dehydrogenase